MTAPSGPSPLRIGGVALIGVAVVAAVIGLVSLGTGNGDTGSSADGGSTAAAPPSAEAPAAPGTAAPGTGGPEAAAPGNTAPTAAPTINGNVVPLPSFAPTTEPAAPVGPAAGGGAAGSGSGSGAAGGGGADLAPTLPLRVYNNSTIQGLAAKAAADFRNGGWTVDDTSGYAGGTIPTSTVYFRQGSGEEASAQRLADAYGLRVEPRFPGIQDASPGLIVIVTKDYHGT